MGKTLKIQLFNLSKDKESMIIYKVCGLYILVLTFLYFYRNFIFCLEVGWVYMIGDRLFMSLSTYSKEKIKENKLCTILFSDESFIYELFLFIILLFIQTISLKLNLIETLLICSLFFIAISCVSKLIAKIFKKKLI